HGKGLGVHQRVVCDEAHALAEQLMGACRIEIHKTLLDGKLPRHTTGWRRWALSKVEELGITPGMSDDQRLLRERTVKTLQMLSQIDETWAWDDLGFSLVFEPTQPSHLLGLLQTLDAYSSITYLSATITPTTLAMLGVKAKDVTYHEMPSTFP